MISSAIWNKQARVNFSKTNRMHFGVFENLQMFIYSKLRKKNHVITY